MIRIAIISLLITLSISLQAQERRDKIREKIETKRIAFLSDKLELTPEEAQGFWPVYNAFHDAMKEARQHPDDRPEITDSNADEMLEQMLSDEQKVLDLKKAHIDKFRDIIGAKKTLMLWHYDRKFKEDMIREIKGRRSERSRGGR